MFDFLKKLPSQVLRSLPVVGGYFRALDQVNRARQQYSNVSPQQINQRINNLNITGPAKAIARGVATGPKIDWNRIQNIARNDIGNNLYKGAKFIAPNALDAVANPSHIYRQQDVQNVFHGKASPLDFLKAITKYGAPIGTDIGNLISGGEFANAGARKAIPAFFKAGTFAGGVNTALGAARGEKITPQKVAQNVAGGVGGQLAGYAGGKLISGVGGLLAPKASAALVPQVRTEVINGKKVKIFAPKANIGSTPKSAGTLADNFYPRKPNGQFGNKVGLSEFDKKNPNFRINQPGEARYGNQINNPLGAKIGPEISAQDGTTLRMNGVKINVNNPGGAKFVAQDLPKSYLGKTDPIVNTKTGQTLSQALDKLKSQGWSQKDINAYKEAVLNPGKAEALKKANAGKLNDLNPTGGLFVDYTPSKRATMPLGSDMTTLAKTAKKNPDELVTIYRGAPKNQKSIVPGDFITTNKDLAKSYAGNGNVLEAKVPASHILDSKSDPLGEEYLYRPPTKNVGKTIAQDIPKSWLKPTKQERSFITTVKESPVTNPQVAEEVKANYTPKSNDVLVKAARKSISSDVMNAEKVARTSVTDKGVATASELIKHYSALGQYDKAIEIAQVASKNLTEAGRTVQAASLYSRISPEGILRYTQAQIDKAGGKPLAPDIAKRLTEMARAVAKMPDGEAKLYATATLQQEIAKQIPSGFLQKATTLRKAGLLTGLRTQAGNAVSNLSHIGLNKISDIPAAGVDAMISLFGKGVKKVAPESKLAKILPGQRTKVFTVRGLAGGAKEGTGKAVKFLKTGVDELGLGSNKYDITPVNFNNKILDKYTKTVFNAMGAADKPYRYSVFRNQLNDMAIAEAHNKGLKGAQAGKFIKEFVQAPPPEAAKAAMDYAEKSVFANDTVLSKAVAGIRTNLQAGHPVSAAAPDLIAPFTKVPSAVVTRLFDFTPVGAVKEVTKQLKAGKLDQRMLAQALGEAGTGTGAIYLGLQLAQSGRLTGPRPTDPKEAALWDMTGKQPNSIKFGNKWYSFNYASPIGQVLQIGANISNGAKEGKDIIGAIGNGIAGGSKAVVDQSFLQGISGALDAITDPTRSAKKFINQTVGSAIPTILADVARGTDQVQRQQNNAGEAIKIRIPGARQTLQPKLDPFGNPLKQQGGLIGNMIDPFRTSVETNNNLTTELTRLNQTGNGVLPSTSNQPIKVGDQTIKLTPQQQNEQRQRAGQLTQKIWNTVINDPRYQGMADENKQKVLSNSMADIQAVNKVITLEKINPDLAKEAISKLSKTQLDILNGQAVDPNKYISAQLPKKPKIKIAKAKKTRVSKGRKMRTAKVAVPRIRKVSTKGIARKKVAKVKLKSKAKLV